MRNKQQQRCRREPSRCWEPSRRLPRAPANALLNSSAMRMLARRPRSTYKTNSTSAATSAASIGWARASAAARAACAAAAASGDDAAAVAAAAPSAAAAAVGMRDATVTAAAAAAAAIAMGGRLCMLPAAMLPMACCLGGGRPSDGGNGAVGGSVFFCWGCFTVCAGETDRARCAVFRYKCSLLHISGISYTKHST